MRQEIKDRIEKIRNGEVPEGYKEIKTCRVPRDWKVNKLKDFANIQTGPFGSLLHSKDYVENGTPIITVEHLKDNKIIHSNLPLVSDDDVVRLQKFKLMEGDVVFSRVGTIDRTGYVTNEESGWLFSGRCLRVRVNSGTCARYVSYCFSMESTKRDIRSLAVGQTMPSLNTQILGAIAIRVPPFLEQQKIATILTTWDKAIELKEQLIEQKKEQKRGLMKKLLNGEVRILKFGGKVEKQQLKGYIKESKLRNKENKESLVLSITNKQGFILQEEQFDRVVASKNLTNYKIICKNQFAYNPSRVNVGSIDLLKKFKKGILSPMYVVFYCQEGQDTEYLNQFLKSELFFDQIPNLLQGSVRDSLSFDALEMVKLFIPTINEQKEIARILLMADKEISLLEKELEALKHQKKGLMQLLLTGIVRVPN